MGWEKGARERVRWMDGTNKYNRRMRTDRQTGLVVENVRRRDRYHLIGEAAVQKGLCTISMGYSMGIRLRDQRMHRRGECE